MRLCEVTYPMGLDAIGYLTYTVDGYVFVALMRAARPAFTAGDPELVAARERARRLWRSYNALDPAAAARREVLEQLLGAVGDGAAIEPPFFCDYGTQITLGAEVFVNFNCVFWTAVRSPSVHRHSWGPRFNSIWRLTQSTRARGWRARNSRDRSASGRASGSAVARSSCPV